MTRDEGERTIDVVGARWFDDACRRRVEQAAELLFEAQRIGIIGNTEIRLEVARALTFAAVLNEASLGSVDPGAVLDLGSGGGLPGLVIAACCPSRQVVLSDRRIKRTDFLERAVRRLRWNDQVSVLAGELPDVADGQRFSSVTARLFGDPAVLFDVAGAVVADGGQLLVSDGPAWESVQTPSRWEFAGHFTSRLDRLGGLDEELWPRSGPLPGDLPGRRLRRFVSR